MHREHKLSLHYTRPKGNKTLYEPGLSIAHVKVCVEIIANSIKKAKNAALPQSCQTTLSQDK